MGEKPLEAMMAAVGETLTKELHSDIKNWIPSLGTTILRKLKAFNCSHFMTIDQLLQTINSGHIKEGAFVSVDCRPSPFAPFSRNHFVPLISMFNKSKRLGPCIIHPNPILGMAMNRMSNLTPVGILPPLDDQVREVALYPRGTITCGFTSVISGIPKVPYLIAVVRSTADRLLHTDCVVKGIVRYVTAGDMVDAGFSTDTYELLRQAGAVSFLDASIDESDITAIGGDDLGELWGGLYADWHLEIECANGLLLNPFIDAFVAGIQKHGFQTEVVRNHAPTGGVCLFGDGIRGNISTQYPIFSLHMDSELAKNFANSKLRFEAIIHDVLANIAAVAADEKRNLMNPNDLDFCCTSMDKEITILQSDAAKNHIHNPLALSIRDWHRRRTASS